MQNVINIAWAGMLLVSTALHNKKTSPAIASVTLHGQTIAYQKADTAINGQWYLLPVLPSDTAAGKYPAINFNTVKGSFTGNTGCNRMNGTFKLTDSSLVFNEHIAATKMLCTGYNEAAFLKNLLSTNRYKREDSVLVLMFNQTELSRWTRKPYKAPMGKKT